MIGENKRCPRCNFKVNKVAGVCPNCKLNYAKFDAATNFYAKQALREGDKERVLLRKGCPSDVSRAKLLLFTIFLGWCGGHLYYVGRYKMGLFYSAFCLIGIVNAIISAYFKVSPTSDLMQVFYLLVLVWGAVLVMWIVDIAKVCFNKFKIPVSLP